MIHRNGDPSAAELRHKFRSLLDGLSTIVIRLKLSNNAGPASANNSRAGLAERCGDPATRTARSAGNHRHTSTKCIAIVR